MSKEKMLNQIKMQHKWMVEKMAENRLQALESTIAVHRRQDEELRLPNNRPQ